MPMQSAWYSRTTSYQLRAELSLFEREEALRVRGTGVVGARPDQPVVRVLLEDVRGPPRDPADGKDGRVQVDRNAERVIRRGRVEIDVRIQLLVGLDQR